MDSKLFLGGGGQSLHGATLYAHAPLQAYINKQLNIALWIDTQSGLKQSINQS